MLCSTVIGVVRTQGMVMLYFPLSETSIFPSCGKGQELAFLTSVGATATRATLGLVLVKGVGAGPGVHLTVAEISRTKSNTTHLHISGKSEEKVSIP
jgi:hypothetical protein